MSTAPPVPASLPGRLAELFFRLLELVLVLCIAGMALMVFGNVVLRYGFNSGIVESEELSRYLFVWLTFIGAVLGVRENAHLGAEFLVKRLPRRGRQLCYAVGALLILWCCWLLFWGTWAQHEVNMENYAPVTGVPMEAVYGVAYLASVSIAAVVGSRLVRLLRGRMADAELIAVQESEEQSIVDAVAAGEAPPGLENIVSHKRPGGAP